MFKRQKFYTVYKITNLLNNKIYVGAHETYDLNDDYMGSGYNIIKAIDKYGRLNFKKVILSYHNSREEMYVEEARIVDEQFLLREDVYNIRIGGPGNFHHINSKGLNNSADNYLKGIAKHKELLETDPVYREKNLSRLKKSSLGNKSRTGNPNKPEVSKRIGLLNSIRFKGSGHPQYNKIWFHHLVLKQNKIVNKEFSDEMIRLGWIRGRKMGFNKPSLV